MSRRYIYTEAKDCLVNVARILDSYINVHNISENKLAKEIGIDRSILRRIRTFSMNSGEMNYKIQFDSVYMIAKFFDMSMSELVNDPKLKK